MLGSFGGTGPLRIITFTGSASHTIANGTSVNGGNLATVVIDGGILPYTVAWADNIANVFLSLSSSITPIFLATGTDVEHIGVASVLVTDAAGRTAESSVNIDINQGSPP